MTPHSLFRPGSLYRLATKDWLWYDNGQTAIQRYFEGLRRQELHAEWAATTPAAQNWGYSKEVDAELHQHLLERQQTTPKEQPEESSYLGSFLGHRTLSPSSSSGSSVFRAMFDGDSPQVNGPENHPEMFGDHQTPQKEFVVDLPVDQPGQACLLLLLEDSLLRELDWLCNQPLESFPALDMKPSDEWLNSEQRKEPAARLDDQRLTEILQTVFTECMIEPEVENEDTLPQFRRAWWVSSRLAHAVGVSGNSVPSTTDDKKARFRVTIPLVNPSPSLMCSRDLIRAVLCQN